MNARTPIFSARPQRGAAALAVAMVLLFGITLIAFFANRTLIFEQRSSANQLRATKAFEMADAGVEWAIARLNDTRKLVDDTCTISTSPTTAQVSFRDRYVVPTAANPPAHTSGWFNPLETAYPGCSVDPSTGAYTCACPGSGAASLANTDHPKFRVQFKAVTAPILDYVAIEVLARGCTNGSTCDPNSAAAGADATAIARVLLKVRPTFPTLPGAGLISGSTTVVSGSLNVVNTDEASNGITINTGSTVNLGTGTTVESLPGTTDQASVLDNDPSLLKLTNADANGELFFSSYFGEGFTDYQTNPLTKVITAGTTNAQNGTCSSENSCGSVVSYWIDRGYTQFWVEPSVTFNNSNLPSTTGGTLGTSSKPIALASAGQLTMTGGINAYGIFYAATASAVDDLLLTGGGSSNIVGALISRGDFARTGNGNISVIYNANLFGGKGPPSGILVPVPGSWRDKATAF